MKNEKWNEICFYLSENIRNGISESEFEQNVIQALRVLNWKEFSGDIQIRPSFQVGASNRIMPDFVINSTEKKNLFVIEIKQPNIPLNSKFQQQLFSYMRQLRLQYGVLIGQVIQIFYDGDLTEQDDPVLLETIEFDKDSTKGQKFVELFSKENFSNDLLQSFTLNYLKTINQKSEQKKLHQKILSADYQLEVLELIKQDFLNKYDAELIDNVLQKISINISDNVAKEQETQKTPTNNWESTGQQNTRDKTKYIINGKGKKLPKGRFVLELVKKYLKKKPSNFSSLKNVFLDKHQGSIGVINTLESVEIKYANKVRKRHFIGDNEILTSADNIQFVVSSEWGKGNINNIVDLARKEGFEITEV